MSALSIDSLFHVGDYVTIDGSSKSWIVEKNGSGVEMTFKVCYELTNVHDNAITLDRISVSILPEISARQSDRNMQRRSDRNIQTDSINSDESNDETDETIATQRNLQAFHSVLFKAFDFNAYNPTTNMKLFTYLKDGMTQTKGWLQSVIQKKTIDPKIHMTQAENHLLVVISSLFSGNTPRNGPFRRYLSSICHAFGVHRRTVTKSMMKFIHSDYTMMRKERVDKGKSVFNCEKKRKHTFTSFNVFKKRRMAMFRETTEKIPEATLKEEFNCLPEEELRVCDIIAKCDYDRSEHLWDELKDLLLKTKGKIS